MHVLINTFMFCLGFFFFFFKFRIKGAQILPTASMSQFKISTINLIINWGISNTTKGSFILGNHL